MKIDEITKHEWYPQSCNGTPFHFISAGMSGFNIKPHTGLTYTAFLYAFKNDYGTIHYLISDLKRFSDAILFELGKDHNYFSKLYRLYVSKIKEHQEFFNLLDKTDLIKLETGLLVQYLEKTVSAVSDAVGVGHLIEPFALICGDEIKKEFLNSLPDKMKSKGNDTFLALTSPSKKSFIQESEDDLKRIAEIKGDCGDEIKKHIRFFRWIKNSYIGRHPMTVEEVEHEIEVLKKSRNSNKDVQSKTEDKNLLLKKLGLSKQLETKIKTLSFVTTWQDERKKNILVGVDYNDLLLEELSKRLKIEIELLRYLFPTEISSEINREKLIERRNGCLILHTKDGANIITGEKYNLLWKNLSLASDASNNGGQIKEIHGMSASTGKVSGVVKVCRSLDELGKVEEGDILVTSMTRPEYLTAMRRAAAFITDEGGVTCHAAIVAREMGKPCIIGTKIATRVLKDGMTVEVDASRGVVKILKKA